VLRSNSYNFVPVLDIERPPGAACPLRGEPSPRIARALEELGALAPERSLFLRLRDRMRLCCTTTEDFTDVELHDVKERLGQLYADVSSKLAPDDFSRDLVKLELKSECSRCERRADCGGCWVAVANDVFSRDDARVREILRRLEGNVLDVGAGDGPYVQELESAARRGKLRYLGIDPDAKRVALLGARHPWAHYRAATLDAFCRAPGSPAEFDHVLILRSYNHLPDPEAALAGVIGRLKLGGSVLVVDNVAFGLVRTQNAAASAERGPAEFEHYRNESSQALVERLTTLGVRVLERHAVGPNTSNQWLVYGEKTSEASS
jgi:SAM-dependent methyltransferase